MKTLILKTTLLLGLCMICFSDTALAVEKDKDRANNQSLAEKAEKNPNKVLQTKKTKKLTFREKIKLIKEIRKEHKSVRKMGVKEAVPVVVLYLLAVILPPVAVGIFTDWGEPTLWNLLFTLIFWLPGVVHAFYILLR